LLSRHVFIFYIRKKILLFYYHVNANFFLSNCRCYSHLKTTIVFLESTENSACRNFAPRQVKCRSEMKPLTSYRGYDNVLLGQGYRTPRGAVIDEYAAMVE
jgi:hypothetical protein